MQGRVVRSIVLAAIVYLGSAAAVEAQDRRGFWGSVGGGWGSGVVTCDECGDEDEREGAGTGFVRLGWGLTDRLLLGAEFNLWSKSFDEDDFIDARASLYNWTATVSYYPTATGFFVKGGAGIASADLEVEAAGSDVSIDFGNGLGIIAGVGYDIPVARRLSITPAVTYWRGHLGDVRLFGTTAIEGWRHNVVEVTVGLTFH